MFFEKFANCEENIKVSFMDDYKILSEEIIKKYNTDLIQQRLNYELFDIEEKQMKYEECDGLANQNYNISINKNSSPSMIVEKDGCMRADLSKELDILYEKYKYVYDNKFSIIEKNLFMQLYIYKRSGNSIRRILHIAYPTFQLINKSIIIKIGNYLGWEETNI
ncbi:MAG: hypothetical protein IJ399_00425 [Bacilli bacterium]|nr:hypothetical protein [Bacilli bacterium]